MYNEIKEIVNFVIRGMNSGEELNIPARQVYLFSSDLANELRERFMGTWSNPKMNNKRKLKIGLTLDDTDDIFVKVFDRLFFDRADYSDYVRGLKSDVSLYANPGEVYSICDGKREKIYEGGVHERYCYLPEHLRSLNIDTQSAFSHVFVGHRPSDKLVFIPLLLTTDNGRYCQPDDVKTNDFSLKMIGAPSHTRRYTVAGFEKTKFGSHRSHKGTAGDYCSTN